MKRFVFAFKRVFRTPSFLLLLILLFCGIFFSAYAGKSVQNPPAGVYLPGDDVVSRRISALLQQRGFLLQPDEETLRRKVVSGQLDCGAVFPEDLQEIFADGALQGAVLFIQSPSSFVPDLYRGHVATVLFSEYAPYLSAGYLQEYDISQDKVLAAYDEMLQGGYLFRFDIVSQEGQTPPDGRTRGLVIGAAALLMLLTITAFSGSGIMSHGFAMVNRIGFADSAGYILWPELAVRAFSVMLTAAAALLAAGKISGDAFYVQLIPAMAVYAVLLTAVALFLAAVLPSERYLNVLMTFLLIGSLALCPIYTDLVQFVPALAVIRSMLPGYWLWLIPQKLWLWAVTAAAAVPAAYGLLCLRYYFIKRYCLHNRKKTTPC